MNRTASGLVEELQGIKGTVTQGVSLLTSFVQAYEENVKAALKRFEEREADFQAEKRAEMAKLEEERKQLYAEIVAEKEKLATEKEMMQNIQSFQKTKIKLDVGGTMFTTSLATLRKDPQSLLATMFSGRYTLENDEEDGSYFIDRDGRHFHHVLNYLRMPEEYDPPKDPQACEELVKEARYYQLEGLRQLLGDDIITPAVTVLSVRKSMDDIEEEHEAESPKMGHGKIKSLEALAESRLKQTKHELKEQETPALSTASPPLEESTAVVCNKKEAMEEGIEEKVEGKMSESEALKAGDSETEGPLDRMQVPTEDSSEMVL